MTTRAREKKQGFTLIEVLIVIVISAILATVAITYNSVSRNQIALSVETAKVEETLLSAKNLAIASYVGSPATCAYGVAFNVASNTYSVFAYQPVPYDPSTSTLPCPDPADVTAIGPDQITAYSPGTWEVPLANGVHFASSTNGDALIIALFYPPGPATLLSTDGSVFADSPASSTFLDPSTPTKVYLVTADGKSSSTVLVNPGGQISL